MVLNRWVFFQFCSVPSNVLKKISYKNIKWHGKNSQISETMSGENCPIFRISQFSWVELHSNILKLLKNGKEFWSGVFCLLPPGALPRWCIKPASLNYTPRKKKCNFPTFLRGEFSLLYMYSNIWVLQENHEKFWNGVFCTLLPGAGAKWNTLQSPCICTLLQKKRNFPLCVSFETKCMTVCILNTVDVVSFKYLLIIFSVQFNRQQSSESVHYTSILELGRRGKSLFLFYGFLFMLWKMRSTFCSK